MKRAGIRVNVLAVDSMLVESGDGGRLIANDRMREKARWTDGVDDRSLANDRPAADDDRSVDDIINSSIASSSAQSLFYSSLRLSVQPVHTIRHSFQVRYRCRKKSKMII